MEYNFHGKRALVTGGSRGIGKEIAKQLIKYGAEVFALSRNQENLDALKTESPSVHTICVDIGDWNATRKAVEEVGLIDFLVNNAGIVETSRGLENISEEEWDRIYSVNLKSVVNISQVITKKLKEQQRPGSFVNMSSTASMKYMGAYAYMTSKAAMDRLTKSMAVELGPHKIRVNSVNPTIVDTDMTQGVLSNPELVMRYKETIPLRCFCTVDDIANTVMFLLSDKANMINGVILPVDGGQCAT